jgi:probable HAF family extracellular repeat protein
VVSAALGLRFSSARPETEQIAEATGVNDLRRIVGTSFDASGDPRVFLWQARLGERVAATRQ